MATILMAEDFVNTTIGTVETFRAWGNEVFVPRSIRAAERMLTEHPPDCATIDQRMPYADGEGTVASDAQVDAFAQRVGQRVPFVWLTANTVSEARRRIRGCQGVVDKSCGRPTEDTTAIFKRSVPSFEVYGAGMHLDQVLVELVLADPSRIVAQIHAWRPEPFEIRREFLPRWLAMSVEESTGKPVFVKARAWLGARRPKQLDLCAYDQLSSRLGVPDEVLWDA
jgi:CheY-like chemotaxis protein